jgi:hypothetical protein
MKKILISTALAAGLVFVSAGSASAGDGPVKATPEPVLGEPGCHGKLNATFNHGSGIQDHGRDSKGPGYTFRDGRLFQEIRGEVWPIFCGPGAGTG